MTQIILVCPGFNPPNFNENFREAFANESEQWLFYPAPEFPPYSSLAILQFWQEFMLNNARPQSIIIIGFSAGVVGAWGTAIALSVEYQIKALIAIDGWGVPLWGNFPIYRLSHDYYTHWSSCLLGGGNENFYAEPAVEHLELWRSPQYTRGWQIDNKGHKTGITAVEFIQKILR